MAVNFKVIIYGDDGVSMAFPLLTEHQVNNLLIYPHGSTEMLQARKQELKSLQLTHIYNFGCQSIQDFNILGLGYIGLVVLVKNTQKQYALKIRRIDAGQADLLTEADSLQRSNSYGIGPQLQQASANFILMEYIVGKSFLEWLKQAIATPNNLVIRAVLGQILDQAFQLDQLGLDRGDMNCITNDVIVTLENQPVLIDFSGASGDRQPKNLTSLVQGLFWGSVISEYLKPLFPHCHQGNLLPLIRAYKQEKNQANFTQLKQAVLNKESKF